MDAFVLRDLFAAFVAIGTIVAVFYLYRVFILTPFAKPAERAVRSRSCPRSRTTKLSAADLAERKRLAALEAGVSAAAATSSGTITSPLTPTGTIDHQE
jgi:hypothetical protein